MWHSREAAQPTLDRLWLESSLQCSCCHQQHVLAVVFARHGQSIGWKECTFFIANETFWINPKLKIEWLMVRLCRANPLGIWPVSLPALQVSVVGIENGMIGALKKPFLDVSVGIHGPVSFQMVGSQRGPNANGGSYLFC